MKFKPNNNISFFKTTNCVNNPKVLLALGLIQQLATPQYSIVNNCAAKF